MNKILFFTAIFSGFTFAIFPASATTDPKTEVTKKEMTEKEFNEALGKLAARVDYLKEAKKNAETKADRKEVKHAIKEVKREAKALKMQQNGATIYIGGGALLAILLLILLL